MKNKTRIDWDRIENFIGFGSRNAPVVFMGMEEGLKSNTDLSKDLEIRSTYAEVMDLKEAHHGIADTDSFFDLRRPSCQRTWRPMCDLMLRRDGVSVPTLEQRNQYQARRLGRSDGDTLLVELLPYPHPKKKDWLYQKFGRYLTRDDYTEGVLAKRKALLREIIANSRRELVVCYGKEHWTHFQAIFDEVRWADRGPFRTAKIARTRIVLTNHFSTKFFNTDEQLAALAEVALERSRRL